MNEGKHILLICTVGGSREPIVATLKRWTPARTHFIATPETRSKIAAEIVPLATSENVQLDPGRYDILELRVSDHRHCVLRRAGTPSYAIAELSSSDSIRRRLAFLPNHWLSVTPACGWSAAEPRNREPER